MYPVWFCRTSEGASSLLARPLCGVGTSAPGDGSYSLWRDMNWHPAASVRLPPATRGPTDALPTCAFDAFGGGTSRARRFLQAAYGSPLAAQSPLLGLPGTEWVFGDPRPRLTAVTLTVAAPC